MDKVLPTKQTIPKVFQPNQTKPNNMAQFNSNLSLYIPVVQKWHANIEYFKNAFRSSFVGNVVRVDFVARNGGDPALATELSAYVYLEWFYNEFSTNWQKVIFAKDPHMPAHFYHTVGRNYWILCENMKPRTVEQVAEEKIVALAKQDITIIDPHGNNAKLLEKLSKNLVEIKRLQCENDEVIAHNAKLESELKETKLNLGAKIHDLNQELRTLDVQRIKEMFLRNDLNKKLDTKIMDLNQELRALDVQRIKETFLRNDLYKNLDAGRTQILKLQTELADTQKTLGDTTNELNIYKRDLPRQMAKIRDLSEEITELEAELVDEKKAHEVEKKALEIEKATLKSQKVSLEEELDDANEDLTRMNQAKHIESLQTRLNCSLSLCALKFKDLEKASAKIQELEGKPCVAPQIHTEEANTSFSCNACSTKVSFTSGKETSADKKHLCHTCFVKIGAWIA